jgi:hypothetical protein
MDEAVERQQIKSSVQTVSFGIDSMIKNNNPFFFYSDIVEGVLRKHIHDVIRILQNKYRGRAVVSRTPGGIVAHKI